jgi:hypothetical protein
MVQDSMPPLAASFGLPISRSTRFANDQFQRDNATPDSNSLTFQQTDCRTRRMLPQFLGLRPNRRKHHDTGQFVLP